MNLCCCEFGVSHDICSELPSADHCRALVNWCVPSLMLMKLPLDFWANLFNILMSCSRVLHSSKYRDAAHCTCMHWVFTNSFHVAIRLLFQNWLLWRQTFFSPGWSVGVFLSARAVVFTWQTLVYLGHKQETSSVWYERAVRSAAVSQCDASLLQYYNRTNMCNCVDRVCFWGTVFVFFY